MSGSAAVRKFLTKYSIFAGNFLTSCREFLISSFIGMNYNYITCLKLRERLSCAVIEVYRTAQHHMRSLKLICVPEINTCMCGSIILNLERKFLFLNCCHGEREIYFLGLHVG